MNGFVYSAMKAYPVLVLLAANLSLMLAALVIWSFAKNWKSFHKETPKELPGRGFYIALMLPPLMWLLAPLILAEAKGPWNDPWRTLFYVLVYRIEDWFILPCGLFFLIFMVYVLVGVKNDQIHADIFKPRKPVWFVFGLGFLFVIWFVPNTLLKTKSKFVGMHIELMFDIGEAIKDINFAAARLAGSDGEIFKKDLEDQSKALESTLKSLKNSIQVVLETVREASNRMADAIVEATEDKPSLKTATDIARKLGDTKATVNELSDATRRLSIAAFDQGLEEVTQKAEDLHRQLGENVLPQIGTAVQKLQALASMKETDEAAIRKAASDAEEEIRKLKKTVGTSTKPERGSVVHNTVTLCNITGDAGLSCRFDTQTRNLISRTIGQMSLLVKALQDEITKVDFTRPDSKSWRINEIQDKAHGLQLAAEALRPDLGIPMLMVGLLFIVFLIMPWLLYISFIVRKRDQIVNDRLELLRDLDLMHRFWNSAKLSRDLTLEGANIARELVFCSETINYDAPAERLKLLKEASLSFKRVMESKGKKLSEEQKKEILYLADTETLNRHTFSSREYLIPLIILSTLSLVGWYYTIFAKGTHGLVSFIEQGGGSSQMTELLAQFTPFTMAFVGAWLFMTIMLTYRWVNNDLKPDSYFYASIRLVWGLVAGMVYMQLFGKDAGKFFMAVAFFVGMCPLEFVIAIWEFLKDSANKGHAKQIVKYFNMPRWSSHQPLTSLEDITVWDDIRFFQEGILNVHSLATADLVRLAMRMPCDAQTLVDWVDQAILRIHTKVLWHGGMSAIGIRNATDLQDTCGFNEQGGWNDEMLTRVTEEFNAVQSMAFDSAGARFEIYREAGVLKTSCEAVINAAGTLKDTRKELDPSKPETLDKIILLRNTVSGLKTLAAEAAQARQKAHKKLLSLGGKAIEVPWADGGDVDQELKALSDGTDNLIARAENLLKEDKLTGKMLEDDAAKVDDVKTGQAALEKAQEAVHALVAPAENAKEAVEKSVPQLDKIKKEVRSLKKKVDILGEKIDTVVSKSVSVKTKGDGLTSTNIGDLKDELNQLQAEASEAESKAGELAESGAACGDWFILLKEKTAALKEALGDGSNQLQAMIKAAIEDSEKGASDAAALSAAQNAVKQIAAFIGTADSTDEKTIAGRIKGITEPFQDLQGNLDKAVSSVADLDAAVSRADILAQGIKDGDAATWDNVKKLSVSVSKLKAAVQSTEKAGRGVISKLDALNQQQTMAFLEAKKKFGEIDFSDAGSKAEAAQKVFDDKEKNVALSAGSSEAKLKEALKHVESAVQSAEILGSGAGEAAEKTMRAVMPSRLTKGLLKVMLDTIRKDPNICHIRHFWNAQKDKAVKCRSADGKRRHKESVKGAVGKVNFF